MLPEGYTFAVVPPDAKFLTRGPAAISYEFSNAVDVLIALGQTVFTIATLYQTRGDQIARYGYAAFGLTVAPYAVMASINFLAHFIYPTFPEMYLVRSSGMLMALQEGATFDGVTGELDESSETRRVPLTPRIVKMIMTTSVTVAFAAISIAIVGSVSSFQEGLSTTAQRVWTMTWLASGTVLAPFLELLFEFAVATTWSVNKGQNCGKLICSYMSLLLIVAFCIAPAVGGFIVVGHMIQSYGVCMRVA